MSARLPRLALIAFVAFKLMTALATGRWSFLWLEAGRAAQPVGYWLGTAVFLGALCLVTWPLIEERRRG